MDYTFIYRHFLSGDREEVKSEQYEYQVSVGCRRYAGDYDARSCSRGRRLVVLAAMSDQVNYNAKHVNFIKHIRFWAAGVEK